MVELDRERLAGAVRMARQAVKPAVVAASMGISRATLDRVERGQHEPTSRVLLAVCTWLGRDPRDFAREAEP